MRNEEFRSGTTSLWSEAGFFAQQHLVSFLASRSVLLLDTSYLILV